MSEAGGDWRSSAAYDFMDAVGDEKIAFEFLRRNDAYAADYAQLKSQSFDEHEAPALPRWGLRFRDRPQHPRRPDRHRMASQGRSAARDLGQAPEIAGGRLRPRSSRAAVAAPGGRGRVPRTLRAGAKQYGPAADLPDRRRGRRGDPA